MSLICLFVDTDISSKLRADDIKLYSCINTTLYREHLNDAINKLMNGAMCGSYKLPLTNVLFAISIRAAKHQTPTCILSTEHLRMPMLFMIYVFMSIVY